jgi:two-component system chemotaxis sensor kinase CheA
MMVDIHGIVNKMGLEFTDEENTKSTSHRALRTAQQMIVFNNAPSEYFAVPLMMITLIERISADDIHRVGSREYYHFKNSTIPILRLEDHLDVSGNREAKEYHLLLPARLNKPIGLLAGIDLSVEDLSDAFDSNVDNGIGLIGTVFRNEHLIMLLDLYALFEKVVPENFQSAQKAARNTQKARLLLAEDNQFFAKLITSYLEQPNIELTVVHDGQAAWDLLVKERKEFDLVVSDIEMTRMNGFDLVRNIKNNPDIKHIPVVALTSLADQDSRARGLKAGFDEYAVKIDKEELLDMVFDKINQIFLAQEDS